jgi:arginine:ornithine antiporter/lysine permease
LIPYFLAAAYAFKLAMSGETYENDTPNVQRNQSIIAGVATVGVVGLWTGRITV